MALAVSHTGSCLILLTESEETVALRDLCDWITDDLCLSQTIIPFREEIKQHRVVDILVEVANINLVVTLRGRLKAIRIVIVLLVCEGLGLKFLKLVFCAV